MAEGAVLDVAIGLVLIYVVFALLASAIEGLRAGIFHSRSRHLRRELVRILGETADKGLMGRVLQHGLLRMMTKNPQKRLAVPKRLANGAGQDRPAEPTGVELTEALRDWPSHIPAETFARALYESVQIAALKEANPAFTGFLANAKTPGAAAAATPAVGLLDEVVLRLEDHLASSNVPDAERAQRKQALLAQWFNGRMQLLTGEYRARTRVWLFVIALFVVVLLNINTIGILMTLYADGTQAANLANASADVANGIGLRDTVHFPIGWGDGTLLWLEAVRMPSWPPFLAAVPQAAVQVGVATVGLLISALAISLGAPFWFDVLAKLVALRKGQATPAAPVAEGIPGVPGVLGGLQEGGKVVPVPAAEGILKR